MFSAVVPPNRGAGQPAGWFTLSDPVSMMNVSWSAHDVLGDEDELQPPTETTSDDPCDTTAPAGPVSEGTFCVEIESFSQLAWTLLRLLEDIVPVTLSCHISESGSVF